jgi:uncharacterized protein YqhQ
LSKETPVYGGQALLEGVMFAGKDHMVSAVRRNDDSIEYFHVKKEKKPLFQKLKKIPFLRGIIALIESAGFGSRHLEFASARYDVNPGEEEVEDSKESSKLGMILSVAAIGILSFLFSKLIFALTPMFIAEFLKPWFPDKTVQILLETTFKLILLFGYLYIVSLTPLIRRVFQFHGAEHKVINCYEANLPLTVENVQKQSRLHYRCGSSFMLFTVFVGMATYFFVPTDPFAVRLISRIVLIPFVIGISFEVLQLTNKLRNVPVLRFLGYPGLWLQLLTTKPPQDDQVEVAIASFNKLHEVEKNPDLALTMHHD